MNNPKIAINRITPVETAIDKLSLHRLADEHPVMTESNYRALVLSIKQQGQLEPVLLYKGKIVDGRHRLKALKELGIATVITRSLPYKLPLQEVRELVIASEVRRHQSATQLAIKAYDLYTSSDKLTQKQASETIGCSNTALQRVVKLMAMGRKDLVDTLRAGKEINVSTNPAFITPTDSLLAIISMAREEQKKREDDSKLLEVTGERTIDMEALDKESVDETSLAIIKLAIADKSEVTLRAVLSLIYAEIARQKDSKELL